jgi:uncharacterized protein (DUF302 family)
MPLQAYGTAAIMKGMGFQDAKEKVVAALAGEGFGILTEIDVQATFKKKLDVDIGRYLILGACNPGLAHRALGVEPHVGLLLPCNVVVQEREAGGDIEVSLQDPSLLMGIAGNPGLEPVAAEAGARLRRVLAALSSP